MCCTSLFCVCMCGSSFHSNPFIHTTNISSPKREHKKKPDAALTLSLSLFVPSVHIIHFCSPLSNKDIMRSICALYCCLSSLPSLPVCPSIRRCTIPFAYKFIPPRSGRFPSILTRSLPQKPNCGFFLSIFSACLRLLFVLYSLGPSVFLLVLLPILRQFHHLLNEHKRQNSCRIKRSG